MGKGGLVILVSILFLSIAYGAVFKDSTEGDFNNGTYLNTTYNGSSVVLVGNNLSGIYTSRVFDAGSLANWNNLSFSGGEPLVEIFYIVDGQADVWKSGDSGTTWSLVKDDYNGAAANGATYMSRNSTGSLFILDSQDLWVSNDQGSSWTKVNDDFNPSDSNNGISMNVDNNDNIFIIDGSEDVFKSTDSGAIFSLLVSNFNGDNGNTFGMAVNSTNALFTVDGQADVWKSGDSGTTWSLVKDDYNGAAANGATYMSRNSTGSLFILDSQDLWVSNDQGSSWTKVNDDFNPSDSNNGISMNVDNNDNIFIIDGSEDVFKSTDSGAIFSLLVSNFNGDNGNTFGFASANANTDLSFQVRNCSLSNCGDGSFSNVNLSNLNLSGRYFQYKVSLSTPDGGVSPFLKNVTISYSLADNVNPNIQIISPLSQNYTNATVLVNISVSDVNLGTIWFFNGSDNVSYASEVFYTFSQGTTKFYAYANDTLGNSNFTNLTFFVDSLAPSLSIVHPQAVTYGRNHTLPLNYSVSDSGIGVASCWYNVNGNTNISILSCVNITFNVSGDGQHILNLFVNDSFGNVENGSVAFSVVTNAPALNLLYPGNDSYINYAGSVTFNYSATSGTGISACQLWGDFNGVWMLNQSNSTISLENNFFVAGLTEGNYNWGVACNDTDNRVSAVNSTFTSDITSPNISIAEPTGTKSSLTVSAGFDVGDNFNVNYCYYNVTDVNGAILILNSKISDCDSNVSLSFTLGSEQSNAKFNLWANDSAGNVNTSSSTFSVAISSGGDSGSGGGGGGGGGGGSGGTSVFIQPDTEEVADVEFSIEKVILKRGTSATVLVSIVNVGDVFLNSCVLAFGGETADWFSNSESTGLSPGETYSYSVNLEVPEDTEPGTYEGDVALSCDERDFKTGFNFAVYRNNFDVEILDYEKDGNSLKVSYFLTENFGGDHEIVIEYAMLDFDGIVRFEGKESVSLKSKETFNGIIEFALPKDSFGEFEFKMELDDGSSQISVSKDIFLPSQGGLRGLAVFDEEGRRLSVIGIVVLLIVSAVVVWQVRKFRKRVDGVGKKHKERHLIELDI